MAVFRAIGHDLDRVYEVFAHGAEFAKAFRFGYNLSQLKRHLRAAQNAKRSKARDGVQKEKNEARIIEAHSAYLELAQGYLDKARATLLKITASDPQTLAARIGIETFIANADRQIDTGR